MIDIDDFLNEENFVLFQAKKSIIDTYRARAMSIESTKSKNSEKKKSTEKLPLMEKNDKRRIVQDEKMEIGRVRGMSQFR